MKHILIVDDEIGPRESLKAVFAGRYTTTAVATAEEALAVVSQRKVDLLLLDVIMPGKGGLMLLKEVQDLYPDIPVIMISASTSARPVVDAIRGGAYDYVQKPFDVTELLRVADRAMESSVLHRRVRALESEVDREFPVTGIIGQSPAFARAMADVSQAAETDSTVLIGGESGTGKELAARLLHAYSQRRDEPFVAVHCGALPETLMESELFGYEKGAFTGAEKQKLGRFDLAGSGTLFFDEVSEMSPLTQVKLLRVLQEREFMRVGGTRVIRTHARIVAASAKDLRREAAEGRFREDLYYRLSVVPVQLPPLRERVEDIPLLARHFLQFFGQSMNSAVEDFEPEAMDRLCRYRWPGNVRELRNIIERMQVLHRKSRTIRPECLPEEFHAEARPVVPPSATGTASLEESVSVYERDLIMNALRETGGVQTRAAKRLGTTRRILRYRMEKLNIESLPDSG